ncbi:MAG TPA: transcriptional repressor LexA [Firmicutes bacterium]|nr:transcriptional repressor LexA [Bacillota bacterium]
MKPKSLSARQKSILKFINEQVQLKGYPPSVREIGAAVGLASSSTVHAHLRKLEEYGYIRRDPTKPRAIEVLHSEDDSYTGSRMYNRPIVNVPVVGQVTAGEPILAVENIEEYFPVPHDLVGDHEVFMVRIKGDSMIEAGIFDRDYVLVEKASTAQNGDIVVALVGDEEATVKRFFHEGTHVRLQPENSAMAPMILQDVMIIGKVIGLFRSIK